MTSREVRLLAHECGFELAGVAAAGPNGDYGRYADWAGRGLAGRMSYLTDRRAGVRADARNLLPTARSMVCVGKLYNTPHPYSVDLRDPDRAWISRYAWGEDYHDVVRRGLEQLAARMSARAEFEYRVCVDTAPLLERSYARDAGLGWIGKNTCLIHQWAGSWFFLGELLTSLELAPGEPAADRCGSCTRCVDACPTAALTPRTDGSYELDARRCISYLTIELKGAIPDELQAGIGGNVFGCDICQDVCPWNRRSAMSLEPEFAPREVAPPLRELIELNPEGFRERFPDSPVRRPGYAGFSRNVETAFANAGRRRTE
ncbi:MAG: tRNA epoxyqueuosine(34) reductase QueG [Acidobacteria bacterium]|nr:tRNA epoxyqueuosine(34) reductase QueG [Acidobacteriota bacterium]